MVRRKGESSDDAVRRLNCDFDALFPLLHDRLSSYGLIACYGELDCLQLRRPAVRVRISLACPTRPSNGPL